MMKLEFYSFWISITHLNNFFFTMDSGDPSWVHIYKWKKLIEVVYITQKVRIIAYYIK